MKDIIALNPMACEQLQIQVSLFQNDCHTYLNTVNILFNDKIIEKIKVHKKQLLSTSENIDAIVNDYFIKKLQPKKRQAKSQKSHSKRKAAEQIINEFNLDL